MKVFDSAMKKIVLIFFVLLSLNVFAQDSVEEDSVIIWEQPVWHQIDESDELIMVAEVMPEFPGGAEKMLEFIQDNIKYPEAARESGTQGRVFVEFVIETDGSISNANVIRGIGNGCDEEAVRLIQSMPKWKPGKQRGEAVRCSYMVPVVFNIECK